MANDPRDSNEEIRRLQGSINDLISLQTLPAIWDGREPGSIVSTLLDVLVNMLRLDFAYMRLSDSLNGSPAEFVQLSQHGAPPPQASEIGRALDRWLINKSVDAPLAVPNPAGDGEVKIAPFRLGLADEIGVLVASSKRGTFPTPTETLLLRTAANQALVALQEARQSHEQKRAAEELERRVADRTAQLTAANEALRESEKKYRTLFDSIDEGFCTIEVLFDENDHPVDYLFLEVNPSFGKQTGIHNARGRRMREIAPQHEERWFEIYGRIALTGEPVRFENQAAQLHRWYDVYAFRVGEPGERKVALLFKDITEQKQSQEAMRAAKARFEGILAIAEDAIISVDANQNIVLFNQGAEKVFGYAENEVIGKPLSILLPQRFVHTHRGHIEEFAKSLDVSRSMAQRREVFGRRKDESEFPAEASISKLALGNEVVFTVILRDITQRKKAEEKLRASETYLAEAQRLSHTGSWAWSVKTKENLYWSREHYRIYGFDPDTDSGQYGVARERIHPADLRAFDENLERAMQEPSDFEIDYRIVLPSGEVKHIHTLGHPVLNNAGELVEYIGTTVDVTEQKRAEKALRRSESYLAEAQRLSHTGSFGWSIVSGEIHWSEETYKIFELDPAVKPTLELVFERMHPDDREPVQQALDHAINEKTGFKIEHRLQMPDGRVKHLHVIARVSDTLSDNFEFVGAVTDVTAVKQAEQRLRMIIDTIPTLAWSLEPDGSVEFVNRRWSEYTGLTTEQARGSGWQAAIHPEDIGRLSEQRRISMASGKPYELEVRVRRHDGQYRWFINRADPLLDEQGRIVKWYGTNTDIDDRKRAEAAVRERESRIRRLVEADIIGVLFWDLGGGITESNDAFLRTVGYSRQDLLSGNLNWASMTPPEYRAANARAAEELAQSGTFQPFEKEFICKDGGRVAVLVAGAMFEGSSEQGVAFILDLTERKRSEEALRTSHAALAHVSRLTTMGELTASIAHEVNQPLTAVVNNANASISLLPKDTPGLEEVRQALTEIIEDADRASDVIARVRQLAKRAPIEKSLLDLRDVVQDVLALARYESATRHVTIRTDLSEDLPSVSGDRVQLQQVLLNLVINGMDAMNEVEESKRVLTIGGRRETHDGTFAARLSVSDSGVGLKPEEVERIFEAFYTTKPQGMGMGLAISHSIIEAHGGRLWAEPNQGPGATFLFSLPAAPECPGEGGPVANNTTS